MSQGRFIVLEGADGVGTTTQARALAALIEAGGGRSHVTAEPSGGPVGVLIRKMLGEKRGGDSFHRQLALLFAADRLDHVEREVAPLLAAGVHVVSDRYLLSSLVYQGLSLPLEEVQALNRWAPAPDATLVLSVPLEEALRRKAARGGAEEVFDAGEVQRRVHERYAQLAPAVGARLVDGTGAPEEVTERLVDALRAHGVLP